MALTLMEERRKKYGPDFWARSIQWVGIVSWLIVLAIDLTAKLAASQVEWLMREWFNIHLYHSWNTVLANASFYTMIYLALLSFGGLIFVRHRPVHKERKYMSAFRLMIVLSTFAIMTHLVIVIV